MSQSSKSWLEDRLHLFYSAFLHSTDAIILTDLQGLIVEANDAFTHLFGWTRAEAIGKRTNILRSAQTTDEFYRQLWEAVNQQGRWQGEICNRRKDGSEVPILLSITPIYQGREKIGYMGVQIDISEKKRIETRLLAEKAFSESIIETANSLIVGLDLQGNIILFNKKCEDTTGYKKNEVLGKSWFDLFIPARMRPEVGEVFKTLSRGRLPSRYENNILTKHGTECLISWSNTFLENEKRDIVGVIGIGIDITELKNLEKQVLLAERWATIGKMAAKVAHEIRNPLSSISLNVELLEDEIDNFQTASKHEAKVLLQAMTQEIDRVSALTEEYLQFSRLPQIMLAPGRLEEVVADVVAFMRHELGQKKIEPEVRIDKNVTELLIDRVQMRRVLLNIMRNAIEAMPRGGKLKIWMEVNEHRVLLHVADTGMGISDETLAKIFEPFFTTKDFGTGLGLAIVQQIIDEHGGQITCTSKLGEGTVFSIALPRRQMAGRDF